MMFYVSRLFSKPAGGVWARVVMAAAALIGLFASGYLLYTYMTGIPISCGLVHGCDTVRGSRWATSWFGWPRPLDGVLFYSGFFALLVTRAVVSHPSRWLHGVTRFGVLVGFIESLMLFWVQWHEIRAFCFWCLLSGVATLIMVGVAWFDRAQDEHHDDELVWLFGLLFMLFMVGGPLFLHLIGRL